MLYDGYKSRLCVSKEIKELIQNQCKDHYRNHHDIPPAIKITDNIVLKSMIQHYLDKLLEDIDNE